MPPKATTAAKKSKERKVPETIIIDDTPPAPGPRRGPPHVASTPIKSKPKVHKKPRVTPAKRSADPKDAPPPLSVKKGGDDDMEVVEEPGLPAVDEEEEEDKDNKTEEPAVSEAQDASYALSEGFEATVEEPADSSVHESGEKDDDDKPVRSSAPPVPASAKRGRDPSPDPSSKVARTEHRHAPGRAASIAPVLVTSSISSKENPASSTGQVASAKPVTGGDSTTTKGKQAASSTSTTNTPKPQAGTMPIASSTTKAVTLPVNGNQSSTISSISRPVPALAVKPTPPSVPSTSKPVKKVHVSAPVVFSESEDDPPPREKAVTKSKHTQMDATDDKKNKKQRKQGKHSKEKDDGTGRKKKNKHTEQNDTEAEKKKKKKSKKNEPIDDSDSDSEQDKKKKSKHDEQSDTEAEKKKKKKSKKKSKCTPTPSPSPSDSSSDSSDSDSSDSSPVLPKGKKGKGKQAMVQPSNIPGTLKWYCAQGVESGRFAELLKRCFYHNLCGTGWWLNKYERITMTANAYQDAANLWEDYMLNLGNWPVPFCGNFPTEFRGAVKMAAVGSIVQFYGLTPPETWEGTAEVYIQRRIGELDTPDFSFAKDGPTSAPGTHPAVFAVAAKVFYRPDVITDSKEAEAVSPLPARCIALVVVALQCALREWASGTRDKLLFSEANYRPTYATVLSSLEELQTSTPDQWEAMIERHEANKVKALGGGSQWATTAAAAFNEGDEQAGGTVGTE